MSDTDQNRTPQSEPEQPPKAKKKFCGVKGRSGAPKKNINALRTGRNIQASRLVVGELPLSMIAVQRESRKYRRDLEACVLDAKGVIDVTDMHLIDTASAATMQAAICRWLLRNRMDKMSPADIRGCTGDVVKAKKDRDAAVKALKLDAPPPDPWSVDALPGGKP